LSALTEIRIAEIFDLHFGAKGNETIEAQLERIAMPAIADFRPHAIIQFGDATDKRLSLESEESKALHRFVEGVAGLGQRLGAKVRFMEGTMSHDYFQLDNFRPLERRFDNFRVIMTAEHEELLPGFDVLWVPEEYPSDADAFYGRFLDGEDGEGLVYDAIFGHGEIDVAARYAEMNAAERRYAGAPVFEAEKLLTHCSGPISFGHIHTRFEYRGRLAYGGSFSRWIHGEEGPKGFFLTTLTRNAEDGWDVSRQFVENTMAPVYKTVDALEVVREDDTAEQMVAKIRAASEGLASLKVRFETFRPSIEDASLIRGVFLQSGNVRIEMPAVVLDEATGAAPVPEGAERDSSRDYLRDKGIPAHERVRRYIMETVPEAAALTPDEVIHITSPAA